MRLYSLHYYFLISLGTLGNSKDQDSWWDCTRKCFRCSSLTNGLYAIFYQNVSGSCISSKVCCFSIRAKCYRDNPNFIFLVRWAFNDESEYYQRRREDEFKYLQARTINFFTMPFQCEFFWFNNEYDIEPSHFSATDKVILGVILRANLDLFWRRSSDNYKIERCC